MRPVTSSEGAVTARTNRCKPVHRLLVGEPEPDLPCLSPLNTGRRWREATVWGLRLIAFDGGNRVKRRRCFRLGFAEGFRVLELANEADCRPTFGFYGGNFY
jgi:hypothetical protein